VFYFGNAIGETGNATAEALVNASDVVGTRDHPRGPLNRAGLDDAYDFNRDRLVNAVDVILARDNQTSPFTMLMRISPPTLPTDIEVAGLALNAADVQTMAASGTSSQVVAAAEPVLDAAVAPMPEPSLLAVAADGRRTPLRDAAHREPEPVAAERLANTTHGADLWIGPADADIEPPDRNAGAALVAGVGPSAAPALSVAAQVESRIEPESLLAALRPLDLNPLAS